MSRMGNEAKPKKERIVKFCPRCNNPYSYIENRKLRGHTYFYAVHESRIDGKRYVHKCYLGAKEYDYVQRMHPEMFQNLTGMTDKERYIRYLEGIIEVISNTQLTDAQREEVLRILEEGSKKIGRVEPLAGSQIETG